MDPSGESLWVNDTGDSMIELWGLAKAIGFSNQ